MSGSTKKIRAALTHGAALLFSGPWSPVVLGFLACLACLATLDVSDDCNWSFAGPGLTFDEGLNVESGVYVVESLLQAGLGALHPATLDDIFNAPAYHPDYPPLGRAALGLANAALWRMCGAPEGEFYVITYARVASALAFGVLVALISDFTRRRIGVLAGQAAGLSLILTPRVFGHAHLACVETMMNLTYTGCVLVVAHSLAARKHLRLRDAWLPGLVLGLAMLTKIQAVFLPPVIVVWILWHWRLKGVLPLTVLGLTALAVFVLGWPWLWRDPVGRLLAYFGSSTDRAVLYCYYLGERYADKAVPWHYPFVTFLLTTPLLFLFLGGWGMGLAGHRSERHRRLTRRENHLLLGAFWLPLVVFALPGVPVYDGERLFLIVWPIFSIWVGAASAAFEDWLKSLRDKRPPLILAGALLCASVSSQVALQPCQLSYYSEFVGGLRGASALGMEITYWGDAVTSRFLKEGTAHIPEGSRLGVAPVLHTLTLEFLRRQSWLRHRPDLQLVAYDDKEPDRPRYVLVIRRKADSWKSLTPPPRGTHLIQEVTRQGAELTELLELPPREPSN